MKLYITICFIIQLLFLFLVNSQLIPNTINPLLVAVEGSTPNSRYPSASNSEVCAFRYEIFITNNEQNSEITNLTLQGPIDFTFDLIKENNKALMRSNVFELPIGYSNTSQLIINSNLTSVTYNLTLSCKEIDMTKVKLKIVNDKSISFLSFFSSTLLLEYDGDPGFKVQLVTGNAKQGVIGISPSNFFPLFWAGDIIQNGNLLDDWVISVNFGKNGLLNVSTKSYYSQFSADQLPSLPYELNYYPSNINNTGVFNVFAPGLWPMVEFKVNSSIIRPLEMVKSLVTHLARPIKGTKGNITYIQSIHTNGLGTAYNCSILTQDRHLISNTPVQVSTKDKTVPYLPTTSATIATITYSQQLFFYTSLFRNENYKYTYLSYSLGVNPNSLLKSWPFGFVSGNNLNYTHSVSFLGNQLSNIVPNNFIIKTDQQSDRILFPANTLLGPNTYTPKLITYEYSRITSVYYLLRVRITSVNGVKFIKFANTYNGIESLVSGDIYDGFYEFVYSDFYILNLVVIDVFGNQRNFGIGDIISIDPFVIFDAPLSSQYKIGLDALDNLSFLHNDLNMLDGEEIHNVVTLNSSLIPIDSALLFFVGDLAYKSNGNRYPFTYHQVEKVFKCSFIIPKNIEFGDLSYSIFNTEFTAYSSAFSSPLIVDNSNVDTQGPIISEIEKLGDSMLIEEQFDIGWKVTITDDVNGFKYGIIKVVGSIDSSTYIFNITADDAIVGDKWSGQYNLFINVKVPCISQSYLIFSVYLYDTNNIVSSFDRSITSYTPSSSPFIKLYSFGESILNILFSCTPSIIDSSPPTLLSFSTSKLIVDVGSVDRSIDFIFSIKESTQGMKIDQLPIIYLISENFGSIECISQFVNSGVPGVLKYFCSTELPLGFGFPGDILFSVYGFVNNGGFYFGFTTRELYENDYSPSVTTTLSMFPIVTSNLRYLSNENELIIIGRCLNGTTNIELENYNGQKESLSALEVIGSSAVKVTITPTSYPFKVNTISGSSSSNIHIVYPIYFNTSKVKPPQPTTSPPNPSTIPTTPTPTPTPTISNSPQTCPGNPVCGGISNGICSSSGLCICNSPWVGSSCTSQVIIVPQPSTNPSDPTIEIPTNPIDSSDENGKSNVFFRSLISLVSLRELDYNGNQVANHIFDKWIFTPITESKNQYVTSVNQGATNITATLEWFKKTSTIDFANKTLIMNPSSVKYTIEISHYQFASTLNEVQLIMSALFESSKTNDICSSKEFGNISSDDHNSDDNYLKIQIENKSLFGRFIKRGYIDNNIKSISNQLLDASLNNLYSSSSSIQSYIAIKIPQFSKSAIIDPDFSILVESKPASSSSENSICTSSSKLSKGQLAGIIVGCVAFTVSIVIAIIYAIIKKRQQKRFIKNINQKLQKM